jgi:hypothetical protein
MKEILPPTVKKHVLLNVFISQRKDAEIYQERKNWKIILPAVLNQ